MAMCFPARVHLMTAMLALCAPCMIAHAEPEPAPQESAAPAAPASPIQFQIRPHAVLHAWARAAVEGSTTAPPVEGSAELVGQLGVLHQALKDDRLWGLIDARVVAAPDAAGVLAMMEKMPETQKLSSGAEISIRDPGMAYARLLMAAVEAWEKSGWNDVKTQLEAARDEVSGALAGAKDDPIAYMKESMGWQAWNGTVPVELVQRAPAPGGVTFRGVNGPVCLVGLGSFEGSMRVEVLLHEVMHAMDVEAGTKDSALTKLRDALIAAGIEPSVQAHRNAWHTVFFVQAGETVRRTIDPNHKDYGEINAYYVRVGPLATAVRESWTAYLRGEKTVDDAIAEIVVAARAATEIPKSDGPKME